MRLLGFADDGVMRNEHPLVHGALVIEATFGASCVVTIKRFSMALFRVDRSMKSRPQRLLYVILCKA